MAEPLIDSYSQEEIEEKKQISWKHLVGLIFHKLKKIREDKVTLKFGSKNEKRVLQLPDSQICKMRSNTSCKNTVYNILYETEPYTKSLQYGRDIMKANARQKFEQITTKKVIECGLVIDPEIPFLAASPGIFFSEHTIMYKLH